LCRNDFSKYAHIVSDIDAIETHKLIAKRQSNAYKRDKSTLSNDTLLIELDWKQKIVIGNLIFNKLFF